MPAFEVPKSFLRASGLASIAAGILMTAGFALHPAGEDATFGTASMWIPAHGLLWLAFVIALLGWVGVYLVQASKAGTFGMAAFVVLLLGTALASWIFSSDVTFVPVIAAESPALFKKIFTTTHTLIGVASVLSWVFGNVLFGISVIQTRRYPPWSGALLIAGTLIIPIAYLAGLSVRVVTIGGAITAVGQARLGYELLRHAASAPTHVGRA
jgi:hypothetical protein